MADGDRPVRTSHLSIGEVLALVQQDFPDITISKIRFLESQGLLDPERTPSGYRKFYDTDIERLLWILGQQRDHFLPLKVIRERLDEWDATGTRPESGGDDAGEQAASDSDVSDSVDEPEEPPADDVRHAAASLAAGSAMEVAAERAERVDEPPADEPEVPIFEAGPDADAMTAEELATRASVDVSVVGDLESFGMIGSSRVGPDTYYDQDALRVVEACRSFLEHGIEVRHLRMYKIAAEREAGVFEQLVMPLLKQRNPDAKGRAVEMVSELADVGEQLHAALLHHALSRTLG